MAAHQNQGEVEWQAAQGIKISVDLIEAAKIQLDFLTQVERHPCLYWNPEVIRKAIHRYTTFWLPLAAQEEDHVAPPLDCAWIWHCHRLSPIQYAKDCESRFGKTIDAPLLSGAAWGLARLRAEQRWKQLYKDEPFNLDLTAFGSGNPALVQQPGGLDILGQPQQEAIGPQAAGYNLADAVARQTSFAYQVSRPYMSDPSFLQASLMRYKGFLHLARIRQADVFLVPTYDIDLFWHSHQLSPLAYQKDTIELIGQIFNHDDTDSDRAPGQKLDVGYAATCRLWGHTFGQEYVRAGVLYRGDAPAPAPVAGPPVSPSELPNADVSHQKHLTRREVLEAQIAVLGGRNVRISGKSSSNLFVRLRVLENCKVLKLTTPAVAASADPEWRHVWNLECETATKGLLFELRKKASGRFLSKLTSSKLLGRVDVPWETLLSSPTLALDQFFPLLSSQAGSIEVKPPALHLSVSVTPPTQGPYLLRTEPLDRLTDDNGVSIISGHPRSGVPQPGRWAARTVLDHAGREVYAVRLRVATGCSSRVPREKPLPVPHCERDIRVHHGGFITERTADMNFKKCKRAWGECIGQAKQCGMPTGFGNRRKWSFSDTEGELYITMAAISARDPIVPSFQLTGSFESSVVLVPGRQLQYTVQGANAADEEGFVTMIRYSAAHPNGKTSALFNWKSGSMEVQPDESVLLVVLLSTAIGTSLFELYAERFPSSRRQKGSSRHLDNQWGAVRLNRGVRDPRDNYTYIGAGDPMFTSMLLYSWWLYSPGVWYSGGGCGGCGACGGGCGADAAGGGGGCGGGGCGGGCGGGGGGGCGGGCGGCGG